MTEQLIIFLQRNKSDQFFKRTDNVTKDIDSNKDKRALQLSFKHNTKTLICTNKSVSMYAHPALTFKSTRQNENTIRRRTLIFGSRN